MMQQPLVQLFVRRFTVALIVVFILTTTGLAWGTWFYNKAVANDPHHVAVPVVKVDQGRPVNYLIVGSDSRSWVTTQKQKTQFGNPTTETGQRSDTIMIAHLDPKQKKAFVLSFPRDLYVTFPGGCHEKINAAFNPDFHCSSSTLSGGPAQILRVMKQNFGIDVNHYLSVNFVSFQGIVDAIGTVDLFIPTVARDTETGLFVSTPGCNTFNGHRALQYVRSREYEYKTDYRQANWLKDGTGDLGRIRRQQYFIRSLAQAAIHSGMSNVSTAFKVIHKALKSLTVEQGFVGADMSALVNAFHSSDPGAIDMQTVPADIGNNARGQSVLLIRSAQAAPLFARLSNHPVTPVKVPDIPTSSVTVDVRNGNGVSGAATKTMNSLTSLGFVRGTIGDTTHHDTTEIRYAPSDATRATLVKAYLANTGNLVADSTLARGTVRIVLGADFGGVAAPQTATTTPANVTTTTAPAANPGKTPGVTVPVTERGRPLVGCG